MSRGLPRLFTTNLAAVRSFPFYHRANLQCNDGNERFLSCLLKEQETLVQLFWRSSVSLPWIIANIKIDCVKKFTAVVVPWNELYNQEVHWNHRFVKIVFYNKHLVESAQLEKKLMDFYGAAQLEKKLMDFYGASPKSRVICS